jgi:hypothetical protein
VRESSGQPQRSRGGNLGKSWERAVPKLAVCENCGRPATVRWKVPRRDGGTRYVNDCDRCKVAGGYDPEPVNDDQPRGLLDRSAAADYLGISVDAFDQHVKPNVRVRMIGAKPMFTTAALDEYADSGAADL